MPSHLTDVGFPVETEDDFLEVFQKAAENGMPMDTPAGTYLQWAPGGGPELWTQFDPEGNAIGLNPHFVGETRMRVAIVARVDRTDGNAMDGAFYAWAEPYKVEPARDNDGEPDPASGYQGEYPFVFDVPDRGRYDDLELPLLAEVQIAAFSHGLRAFTTDDEYTDAQEDEPKFAPESFIPTGLFTLDAIEEAAEEWESLEEDEEVDGVEAEGALDEEIEEEGELPEFIESESPRAEAVFAGHVLDTAMRLNPATGQPYLWARVKTLGGEVDVVADPETIDGEVVTGGVIHGEFWLSGRLILE